MKGSMGRWGELTGSSGQALGEGPRTGVNQGHILWAWTAALALPLLRAVPARTPCRSSHAVHALSVWQCAGTQTAEVRQVLTCLVPRALKNCLTGRSAACWPQHLTLCSVWMIEGTDKGRRGCSRNETHPYLEPWRDQTFMPAFCAMLLGRYAAGASLCAVLYCMLYV